VRRVAVLIAVVDAFVAATPPSGAQPACAGVTVRLRCNEIMP
jgi:hypothetical protein